MLVHTLNYAVPEGKSFISINEWVETLPMERQQAFAKIAERQQTLQEARIAAGTLISTERDVIHWNDNADPSHLTPDPEWKAFFEEYLAATGMTLNVVETKV